MTTADLIRCMGNANGGKLTPENVIMLLNAHGHVFVTEAYRDLGDLITDAEELLIWLGY